MTQINVKSPNVKYTDTYIESQYKYNTCKVTKHDDGSYDVSPKTTDYTFRTKRNVPRLGVMLVGWGGNNGTTVTGSVIANKLGLTWDTKHGRKSANYFGSLTQASTVLLGTGENGDVYVPLKSLLPMVNPNDIVFDGWDISSLSLGDAMRRAEVFDHSLQQQLYERMQQYQPRPSIYIADFIAANQSERADNILTGTKQSMLEQIRADVREFRSSSGVDAVLVLWTANTERFSQVQTGLNDTAASLLSSIERGEEEVAPSTLFAVASILEGVTFINGSPQNTFVPGVIELANQKRVYIAGDDFKSGQTKVKSVLTDFLVSAGIKLRSIVSYNHLGNNDGKNLSVQKTFRSKEISKSCVVDDMVASNEILYPDNIGPDHTVVIKYVPHVGDSKRAMDEYSSEIMMGGANTIVLHNTCEDSLLAAPLILDLAVIAELCQRIEFRVGADTEFQRFNSVLSILSYLCKAPLVPRGTPIVNALFRQRACIENIFRACIGLPPLNNMMLEHKHEDQRRVAGRGEKHVCDAADVACKVGRMNGSVGGGAHMNGVCDGAWDGVDTHRRDASTNGACNGVVTKIVENGEVVKKGGDSIHAVNGGSNVDGGIEARRGLQK